MDELARWLSMQLDEDERIARAAVAAMERIGSSVGAPVAQWVADHHLVMRQPLTDVEEVRIVTDCAAFGGPSAAAHIAEHDPARVLREIEAKRGLLARVQNHAAIMGRDEVHNDLLRLLALPYADLPGFQESWRP